MSQETLQPKPIEQPGGLTPEQQQTAIEHRQRIRDAASRPVAEYGTTHTGMLSGEQVTGPSVLSAWEGDISRGIRDLRVNSAKRSARRHYKKHQGAYQEQALKEATEAGVEINFGPNERKDKKHSPRHSAQRRLGNTALAAIDSFMAEQFVQGMIESGKPIDGKAVRDIVTAYLAYRFGKGAVVRGKAALTGRGDPEKALATPVSMVHESKKALTARRLREELYPPKKVKPGPLKDIKV